MKAKRILTATLLTFTTVLGVSLTPTDATTTITTQTAIHYEHAKIKSIACINNVPSVHFVDSKGNEYVYSDSFYLEADNWDDVVIELVLDNSNNIVDWYYWN